MQVTSRVDFLEPSHQQLLLRLRRFKKTRFLRLRTSWTYDDKEGGWSTWSSGKDMGTCTIPTWEPTAHFKKCPEMLQQFHQRAGLSTTPSM